MARDRIIYNVEGLFVYPYSGEQVLGSSYYISGNQILKRIENIQSLTYSIDQNRINLGGFGSKKDIFKGLASQPNISLRFNYIPDGLTNEDRLSFDVATFQSTIQPPMFSGMCQDNSVKDEKDFYLIINKNNNDIFSNNQINSLALNPTGVQNIIDPNCPNYSLLHFQNCFITDYQFNIAVGELPNVEQNYVADNIVFYLSGSGIKYSSLDLRSGNLINSNDNVIIPRYFSESPSGVSGKNILLPGDANVSFFTKNTSGVLFYTDTLQNLNFGVTFDRIDLKSLNYKFPLGRNINFPINCNLDLGFIVEENLSGSFFDTLNRDEDYNIVVNFNSNCIKPGVSPTRFIFSGFKFNNISYNSNIGTNKTASLSFNTDLDPDFGQRGIFVSGNVLYGFITGQKKILIY